MTRHRHEFHQRLPASQFGASRPVAKTRIGYVCFARHFGAMVSSMYAGMFVLGPVYKMTMVLTGIDDPWDRRPVLLNNIMAFSMSVPMFLYLRLRSHSWRNR